MTIQRHSRARQIELGLSIARRRKIYLDARFWIIMRDTALGLRSEPAARNLLHNLRRGVAGGRLVCPISASMFDELLKQPLTPNRRIGTARLIGELSLGVSMISPQTVMGTEIHSFFLHAKGDVELHPMQELIWTRAAYVFGNIYPSTDQLTPEEKLAVQKAFFDCLWGFSFSDVVTAIAKEDSPPDKFAALSQETNEANTKHKDELRSFAQTYDAELRGAIEVAGDVAADAIHHLAEKDSGHLLSPTRDEREACVNMCRNLLYRAFKKPETKRLLRSIHIGASIHAAMRWDKQRKFRPNDYYDFEHATAALGYCDAFLTEGPLHHLVTRPPLNLEEINGCRVFSDIDSANDHIRCLSVPS